VDYIDQKFMLFRFKKQIYVSYCTIPIKNFPKTNISRFICKKQINLFLTHCLVKKIKKEISVNKSISKKLDTSVYNTLKME